MNIAPLLRVVGYFVGMAVTDIAVGLWEESKMRREMRRYENANGGEVYAHTVTEETEGTVMTPDGTGREVKSGDVLVGTNNPDVFNVGDPALLDGYSETADSDSDATGEDYDPSQYSATEVRAYLARQRSEGNRSEFERVTDAEKNGRNRSTALDGEFDR